MSQEPTTLLRDLEILEQAREQQPSLFYRPHDRGQIQFHKSPHIVRAMFPGNGWGKTRAMGTEVAWWVDHSHPYQQTPEWPVQIIWFCQEFRQFDILKAQLETECFTAGWTWNEQKHKYRWPNGDTVSVASCDRSWKHLQGINPDLICFDEQPPLGLWREMLQRRRGKRKTRFIVAATATDGESWMEVEVYKPWLKAHEDQNISPTKARGMQVHPEYWVWDHGGIDDNPGADAGDRRWYHNRTWSSTEEKRVRLFGGFGRFNGSPVFDLEALLIMEQLMAQMDAADGGGKVGSLEVIRA